MCGGAAEKHASKVARLVVEIAESAKGLGSFKMLLPNLAEHIVGSDIRIHFPPQDTGLSKKTVPLFEIPALNLPGNMASPWLANLP